MIYNGHFQNFKSCQIPKARLIIADIPYNIGNNAYASNPSWYEGGDAMARNGRKCTMCFRINIRNNRRFRIKKPAFCRFF